MSQSERTTSIRDLARPEIRELTPYASARGTVPNARHAIRLDANESPWPPFPSQEGLNRYPEPQPSELTGQMGQLYGVGEDHLLVTRGSDEAIDLLTRVFCRPDQDAVVVCPPTFGLYRVAAAVQGAKLLSVPRDSKFDLETNHIAAVCNAESTSVKLVFLCTPNNPTGNVTPPEDILELARALPNQIVVVDEAYIDFASVRSLSSEVTQVANLVVLRTLSKAFGLAGARCGATLAQPEIIRLLRSTLAPYPIPSPTVRTVLDALVPAGLATVQERIARTRRERRRLAEHLERCPEVRRVFPSEANFLLLETHNARDLTGKLRARGILVRYFGDSLPELVRLSVGTTEENNLLLTALGVDPGPVANLREAIVSRRTKETNVTAVVNLDNNSETRVKTGIGFYDHMLEQIARHGGFGLRLDCQGDLEIDTHHTVEDCALVLGEALRDALGDKRGIERYGFVLPMDEARAEVLIDLSGRPTSVFKGTFPDERVGEMATEMVPHVFESLAQSLGAAIHVRVEGNNSHHMVESCFKGLGRALRQAIRRDGDDIPSTKGIL